MSAIVQFTHPGSEHGPDKGSKILKSWNLGKHQRKFILSKGQYVHGANLTEADLVFWGEWEPPSHVEKLAERSNNLYPKWLHRPFLPRELPVPTEKNTYQNTDPCVFGSQFKYICCKQDKRKNKNDDTSFYQTKMAKLEKGSMILFGSTKGTKENIFFQLDTVFIVSSYIDYDTSNPDALINEKLGDYRDFVFKMAFPKPTKQARTLRLYKGATFDNKYEGMYSFSPALVWGKQKREGFPRIALKDMDFITNNLNSAPKITEVPIKQITECWKKIRKITKEQGCVEGVSFAYPHRSTQ
jgi:hypothetical protein